MKKFLYLSLFLLLIVPSIASAAWWNPFSWSIFHKKAVVEEIVPVQYPHKIAVVEPVVEPITEPTPEVTKPKSPTVVTSQAVVPIITPVQVSLPVPVIVQQTNLVHDICPNVEGSQEFVPADMWQDNTLRCWPKTTLECTNAGNDRDASLKAYNDMTAKIPDLSPTEMNTWLANPTNKALYDQTNHNLITLGDDFYYYLDKYYEICKITPPEHAIICNTYNNVSGSTTICKEDTD